MKLSIIIPYYYTPEYTSELLQVLGKQINDDVEVFLINDGSDISQVKLLPWVNCINIEHGGQGKARNTGLDLAKGDYVQFIDSDDIVSSNFISKLLETIPFKSDVIEFSWKSLNNKGDIDYDFKLNNAGDRLPNPSVCTRCFKRSYIGDIRFSEIKDAAEDEDFSRRLGYIYKPITVSIIPEYLYFYRNDVPCSNSKMYVEGMTQTKRIIYYYKEVTADRTDILENIKKDDEMNEVLLMTERCDIPEIRRWCTIIPPCDMWAHEYKGEPIKTL